MLRRQMAAATGQKESVSLSFLGGEWFTSWKGFTHHGHALLGGKRVDVQMEKSATEGVEEGGFWSTDMDTDVRTCRSRHARNSVSRQIVVAHLFHKWLPPIFSCGWCSSTLSIGTISRFRPCRGSWRLKIHIKRSFCIFWKSNICTDQLDEQKANVSISQLHRIRGHIVGCWFANGWFTCARLVGFGCWSAGNDSKNTKTHPSVHTGNWFRNPQHTQDFTSVGSQRGPIKHRFRTHLSEEEDNEAV